MSMTLTSAFFPTSMTPRSVSPNSCAVSWDCLRTTYSSGSLSPRCRSRAQCVSRKVGIRRVADHAAVRAAVGQARHAGGMRQHLADRVVVAVGVVEERQHQHRRRRRLRASGRTAWPADPRRARRAIVVDGAVGGRLVVGRITERSRAGPASTAPARTCRRTACSDRAADRPRPGSPPHRGIGEPLRRVPRGCTRPSAAGRSGDG